MANRLKDSSNSHSTRKVSKNKSWKKGVKTPFFLAFLMFLGGTFSSAVAQDVGCQLVTSECIDMTEVGGGGSVILPSNVTRLTADGVSICLSPSSSVNVPGDIIFVVDQSGSMTYTDPGFVAPTVVYDALEILDSLTPASHVGFFGFGNGLCDGAQQNGFGAGQRLANKADTRILPGPLNSGTQLQDLFYEASYSSSDYYQNCGSRDPSGTNYYRAFLQTNSWLSDDNLTPHDRQAIIFVTDGEPTSDGEVNEFLNLVQNYDSTNYAAVYAIMIGKDYGPLEDLTIRTGGGYYPNISPSQLSQAMQEIVNTVIAPGVPVSTTIENQSLNISSVSTSHLEIAPAEYQVQLDSVLPLQQGTNVIEVTSIASQNGIQDPPVTYTFTIDASGPVETRSGDISLPDSLFDITCSPASRLVFTNSSYTPIAQLTYPYANNFGLQLTSYSNVSPASTNINTTINGDSEIFNITRGNSLDSIYRGTIGFSAQTNFTANNLNVEEINGGMVIANWVHPRDPRDAASDTLLIIRPQVEPPQYTSSAGNNFSSFTNITLFTDTPSPTTIYYTTDGSVPTSSSTPYTGSFQISNTTTIRAIATKAYWDDSEILTFTVTRTSSNSQIEILDPSFQPFLNNTLYNSQTSYSIQLSTNYYGNATLQPVITAVNSGDVVNLSLTSSHIAGSNGSYARIYQRGSLVIEQDNSPDQTSVLETSIFDTLIITWTNPLDGSDVVSDTVFVQPDNQSAQVYFSTSTSLADTVSSFGEANNTIYVIVVDQTYHPDSTYTVSLVSDGDVETVTLSPSGGNLVGSISLSYDPITQNDGDLQAKLPGDAVEASYNDPIFTSDVATKSVTINPKSIANPTVEDNVGGIITSGTYFQNDTTIYFDVTTPGAQIRYTLDGATVPSNTQGTLYTPGAGIFLDSSVTVRVVAYLANDNIDNFVISSVVTVILNDRDNTGLPYAIPTTTYFTEDTTVTLYPDSVGDNIHYTLDGSNPATTVGGSTLLYSVPLTITSNTTLRFRAVDPPKNPSGIVTEVYTKRDTLEAPTANPPSGTIFSGDTSVVLSNPTVTNAIIRYTTDGTTPTVNSQRYLSPIVLSQPTTIRAIAFNPQGSDAYVQSPMATFNYTPRVPTPIAIPGDTSFGADVFVRLSVPTTGANIYYTLDGTTPNSGSTAYTQQIHITKSDTLRVIATKTGWANSEVLVVIYTKLNLPSSLSLLDGNLQEVAYITERNNSFYVVIQTSEADLNAVTPLAVTTSKGDSEILNLSLVGRNGDYFKYQAEIPFSVTTTSPGSDGTIQADNYDNIVVSWTNPNNSSDAVADTLSVRPFPVQSDIFFTTSLSSTNRLSEYNGTEDSLYLIIKDQAWDLSKNYQVTIISIPTYGQNRGADTLTLPITLVGPGTYGVVIPVDKNPDSNSGDNLLQIVKADKITASYADPVDNDEASTQVNYGSAGEVTAQIMFTNSAGIPIPDGEYYDPASDSLYLIYIDDYTLQPKSLTLSVTNTTGTGKQSRDGLTIDLGSATQEDSIGYWRISIPMDENQTTNTQNNIIEVFFNSLIVANVNSHSKDGIALGIVQDILNVANEDEPEVITIRDSNGSSIVTRETDTLLITLNDQNFTSVDDSVYATIECLSSGDVYTRLLLIEQPDGSYQGIILKNEEEVEIGDDILSCSTDDDIKVSYSDPVYKNNITANKKILEEGGQSVEFIDSNGDVITNLDEYNGGDFRIKVIAFSESQTEVDTLTVTLVNSKGESIQVKVIETDVFSGEFISSTVPYTFLYKDEKADPDVLVVGVLDDEQSQNSGTITAILQTEFDTTSSTLDIDAAYVPVERSWIIDGNSDGRADSLFIKFTRNLQTIPNSILSIDWPAEGDNDYTAEYDEDKALTEIFFYKDAEGNIDSSIIVISLKDNGEEFSRNATKASETNPPKLTLPSNNVFKGKEVEIMDSVSPTIVKAERRPSDLGFYDYVDVNGKTRYKQNPDTLIVTISEYISLEDDSGPLWWDSLIVFSQTCDKDNGHFLQNFEGDKPQEIEPDENGNPRWMFIVTNEKDAYKPSSEGCVWLNPDARYSDAAGNRPSNNDVPPVGLDDAKFINDSKIFNPVVGVNLSEDNIVESYIAYGALDEDGNLILPEVQDGSYVQLWIPPQGLKGDGTIDPKQLSQNCNENTNLVEEEDFREYPQNCLSSVFVESLGGYVAEVEIYDHLGKFIHRHVQSFGKCGETANENRLGPNGFRSWLVWNMKDAEGNFVGSGVYVWKVKYRALDQTITIPTAIYKQGIARSKPPRKNCADN